MSNRDLHLARLKRGLARIPDLRNRDPLLDDPDFDEWRAEMMDSLDAVLPESSYSLRLANTQFRDHAAGYASEYIPDHEQCRANGLRKTELLLTNAIEEAEATPPVPATPAPAPPGPSGIVINVTNVLSQSVHIEMAQLIRAIDDTDLSTEQRAAAKAFATSLDQEIRGQQRWPVLAKGLEGLRTMGKGLYEKIAIPLLLELLKKQAGL